MSTIQIVVELSVSTFDAGLRKIAQKTTWIIHIYLEVVSGPLRHNHYHPAYGDVTPISEPHFCHDELISLLTLFRPPICYTRSGAWRSFRSALGLLNEFGVIAQRLVGAPV